MVDLNRTSDERSGEADPGKEKGHQDFSPDEQRRMTVVRAGTARSGRAQR